MRRKYKSGSRWAFWRWTDVDSEFITRLHVLKTPRFAVCLHWINKPDPEPYLHDHPVSFLSIILRGEYSELRGKGEWIDFGGPCPVADVRRRRWWNWIRASDRDVHSIVRVKPGTLTLCLMGPKRREWGFHAAGRWIHWKAYYEAQRVGVQL